MKILFLAPEPFFEARGTPIAILNLIRVLSGMGHAVDLVTYHLGQAVCLDNLKIKRTLRIPFIKKVPIGPSYRKLFLDFFLFIKAFWLCLFNKYDLIHGVEEGAYLGAVLAAVFRKSLVYDMDSHIPDQLKYSGFFALPFFRGFIDWFEKFTVRRSAVIISVCADLSQRIHEKYPGKKLFQIEDLPLFETKIITAEEKEKIKEKGGFGVNRLVLYTGNFESYQGLELLIEAARIIVSQKPEVLFILVGGEKDQIEKMKKIAATAGVGKNFVFSGKLPMEEISSFSELADVLISPRIKGTNVPMKIYSYLNSRRPIVATNILSHTQVLDNQTAVLVRPEAGALAEGILQLLNDASLADRLAQKAFQLAEEKYSPKIYEQKVREAYGYLENLLNKKGSLN